MERGPSSKDRAVIGPQRCAGNVVYDEHGNFVERFACEVHLFTSGNCAWQQAVYDEREAKRRSRYPKDVTG